MEIFFVNTFFKRGAFFMKFINYFLLFVLINGGISDNLQARSFFNKIFTKLDSFNKTNRQELHQVFDNFYEVEQNKFYRTQQLPPEKLAHYIKKFTIKTVINLRGSNDTEWCQQEKIATETTES